MFRDASLTTSADLTSWSTGHDHQRAMLYSCDETEAGVRLWLLTLIFLLTVSTAAREKIEPDALNISGNTIESPYFKFHYSFPQGWLIQDDKVRVEKNRETHKKAGVFLWTYNLLLASAGPISDDKLSLPYIHILAIEKAEDLFGNGKYAKSLAKTKSLAILHPPQQLRIAGQNFTRTDLADKDVHYEALLDTTARNYFLLFEFHGRTQEEMEALVKTMESTTFDK
jgi:hypothetical protein